eukprot:TRINITY_DN3176_c0_g2_i1.p1 TRINITY_DN3176_c0_g2~~TRINITY_DN3176_c0_g2_i1.p1  ORF type:complete len:987 (-),score=179.27 TRINITY_DN3176_c0_g2_i1:1217-4177(-)
MEQRKLAFFFAFVAWTFAWEVCHAVDLRGEASNRVAKKGDRFVTLFSVECKPYFDWQTVGLMHSYRKSGQPGPITRLLSCTDEALKSYNNMDLAPTLVVPSWTKNPHTNDWYPAINKPAGVVHWLNTSPEANEVDWVLILDADQVIRAPITPWDLQAEIGKPVAAYYGYLIGCDNVLAQLHTKHPEYCDKVGGFIMMHISDLRKFAPLWLSKTEEVREDRAHYATNITGDIYGQGWISEMYGYSFAGAELMFKHKIDNEVMLYPGYVPSPGIEPKLLHYGLPFGVGSWTWGKSQHHDSRVVDKCNSLFPQPPYPSEVNESDEGKKRGALLSIECVNTLNEGLMIHHRVHNCPEPLEDPYLNYLRKLAESAKGVKDILDAPPGTKSPWVWSSPKVVTLHTPPAMVTEHLPPTVTAEATDALTRSAHLRGGAVPIQPKQGLRLHTLFSTECNNYFDWQTAGLVYSFKKSGQPGPLTRLLSCTEEDLKSYKGLDLAPTHIVPSWTHHPTNGDWYPAYNKPVSVLHWLQHSPASNETDFVVILDADMILRKPIIPWELGAHKGLAVSADYSYLIGCDNILATLHTKHPESCPKVGGYIVQHIDDIRKHAPLWLSKTEEVRMDKDHYATNITGDVYGQGWISEMYGYSFGAAEIQLKHKIMDQIMLYPGYIPPDKFEPHVLHYGLEFEVGNWKWDKAMYHDQDMTNICGNYFPEPPDPSTITTSDVGEKRKLLINIECVHTINVALHEIHLRKGCPSDHEDFKHQAIRPDNDYPEDTGKADNNAEGTEQTEGRGDMEEKTVDAGVKQEETQDTAEPIKVVEEAKPTVELVSETTKQVIGPPRRDEDKGTDVQADDVKRRKDQELEFGSSDKRGKENSPDEKETVLLSGNSHQETILTLPEDVLAQPPSFSIMLLFSDPLAFFDMIKGWSTWMLLPWATLVVGFLVMISSLRKRFRSAPGPGLHAKTQHLRRKRLYNKGLGSGLASAFTKAN